MTAKSALDWALI